MAKNESITITQLQKKVSLLERKIKELKKRVSLKEDLDRDFIALLENTPDFIYIKDNQHRFTNVSTSFARLTKYKERKKLIGKTNFDIFPLEHAKQYYASEKQVMEKGEPLIDHEEPYYGRKGDLRWVISSKRAVFNENGHIVGLIGISKDITERKEYEKKFRYLASHDLLTGLLNRNFFEELAKEKINHAQRYQSHFVILFVDIDGFKNINDHYGHTVGDEVLIEIGDRLKNLVRKSDHVARLGGDEFVILLDKLKSKGNILAVVNKILKKINHPIAIEGGGILSIECSVGIARYPKNGETIHKLIDSADKAMYVVKKNGKNNFCFSDSMV